jgi:hypothetical protein
VKERSQHSAPEHTKREECCSAIYLSAYRNPLSAWVEPHFNSGNRLDAMPVHSRIGMYKEHVFARRYWTCRCGSSATELSCITMSERRKRPESSSSKAKNRAHGEAHSSRRNFLKTAGVAAATLLVQDSSWAQGKTANAASRDFAFPNFNPKFMITPDQAWGWASFKSQGGLPMRVARAGSVTQIF